MHCVVSLLLLIPTAGCLLLDDLSCPANNPCFCSGSSNINCSGMNLTTMPTFNNTMRDFGKMNLDITNNHISALVDFAFASLNHVVQNEIAINLSWNRIHSISEHAFDLVQNSVVYLDLEHNNLQHLPSALGHLSKVRTLLLAFNPLKNLDYNTMHTLGRHGTLSTFSFGYIGTSWPSKLSDLRSLNELVIEPSAVDCLNCYLRLPNSLRRLTIGSSLLDRLPYTVCNVHQLEYLKFNTDAVFDSYAAVPYCSHTNPGIKHVVLTGQGLTGLPSYLFRSFPSIETLELSNMTSSFSLDDSKIPENCSVRTLVLHADHLASVPNQVAAFTNLEHLDLGNNPIQCSCLMKWMGHWERLDNVTIDGQCENYHMSIEQFIHDDLNQFCL